MKFLGPYKASVSGQFVYQAFEAVDLIHDIHGIGSPLADDVAFVFLHPEMWPENWKLK